MPELGFVSSSDTVPPRLIESRGGDVMSVTGLRFIPDDELEDCHHAFGLQK